MIFLKDDSVSDFAFQAIDVWFTKGELNVLLTDGRVVSNPLSLYPFLLNIPRKSREKFRLFGEGSAIHFEDIEEDISVTDIVLGIPYFDCKSSSSKKTA